MKKANLVAEKRQKRGKNAARQLRREKKIPAILYGRGDFMKTVGIAVSAGYDCDNQAATCAGLVGVMHGLDCIPDRLTKDVIGPGRWQKPFNDTYLNFSRDHLPIITKISDIVDRIAAVAETAILQNQGQKTTRNGKTIYTINCNF